MERYSRQEFVIGKKSQGLLSKSKVCIVGIGALGTFSSELLARAGVGCLKLVDRDIVELHNLQRQKLFSETDIGKPKALAAKKRLEEINSDIKIEAISEDITADNIAMIKSDLVLDCTDNLSTRFLINDYCIKNKIPWIYSAAIGTIGRVMAILPKSYCFRCHFKKAEGLDTCDTAGILNTTIAMTSSIQVSEAIKILISNKPSSGLISIDSTLPAISIFNVNKNPECKCCALKQFEYLSVKNNDVVKFCGSGTYQVKGNFDFNVVKKKLHALGKIMDFGSSFSSGRISVFNGRALIKAKDEKEAKTIYAKFIGN